MTWLTFWDILGTVVQVKEYHNKRKSVSCEYGAEAYGQLVLQWSSTFGKFTKPIPIIVARNFFYFSDMKPILTSLVNSGRRWDIFFIQELLSK